MQGTTMLPVPRPMQSFHPTRLGIQNQAAALCCCKVAFRERGYRWQRQARTVPHRPCAACHPQEN
jgi:hypothetical protein